VRKYDARRGLALLLDEKGSSIRVPRAVLRHSPELFAGSVVAVFLDEDGRAARILAA
jgi:hypothetical protein